MLVLGHSHGLRSTFLALALALKPKAALAAWVWFGLVHRGLLALALRPTFWPWPIGAQVLGLGIQVFGFVLMVLTSLYVPL